MLDLLFLSLAFAGFAALAWCFPIALVLLFSGLSVLAAVIALFFARPVKRGAP